MKRKYRIKSKGRFALFLLLVLIMVLFTSGTVLGLNRAALNEPTFVTIEVGPGDTLWELASEFGPEGHDIRKVVREICIVNDISADQLKPGQLLQIPEYF